MFLQPNSRHSLPNDFNQRSQKTQQAPPLPPQQAPPPPPPPPNSKPPKSIFDIDSPPPLSMSSTTLSKPVKLEMGDIFEDETDTKPKTRDISPSVVKLNKVEDMSGFEKLRDGRSSIKIPIKPEFESSVKQELFPMKQEVKQEFSQDSKPMVVDMGKFWIFFMSRFHILSCVSAMGFHKSKRDPNNFYSSDRKI